jgi:hypothetical protein
VLRTTLILFVCAMSGHLLLAAERLELLTPDGVALALRANGSVESLRAGAANVLTPGTSSGFWVQDVKTGVVEQALGHAGHGVTGLVFSGRAPKLKLAVRAELFVDRGAVRMRGYVEDETGQERAADLQIRLYCQARGAQWARDTQVSEPLGDAAPQPRWVFPFQSLALPAGKGAFALAVAAEEPAIFEFVYEDRAWFGLKLKYGLSKFASARLRGRANFETLLYAIDPQWGFRSATETYYRIHQRWFVRRATRDGMWLHNYHAEKVPNPWDYAYRVEVNGPKKQGWENDARQGIPTIEYLITGMRELRKLPVVPETYAGQMKALEETRQPYTHNITADSGYRSPQLERDVILNSGMFDGDGRYRILPRNTDWGGASLTFPLNTSPHLFSDRPVPTVGKITMEWVRWLIRDTPFIQGVFVDSLYGWGRYFNCRTEHFPYARVSLTYDPESHQPAIANMFANQEFLYALGEVLHPGGRLVMGNGPRAGRFFNGMALDILATESPVQPRQENDIMGGAGPGGGPKVPIGLTGDQYQNLIYDRIAAGHKPHMIMNFEKSEWQDLRIVELFWKLGLHFGIYPGYRQTLGGAAWEYDSKQWAAVQKIINRYNPLLKQITAAGWQPVTRARADNPAVWLERYGTTPPALFFTVMNTGPKALRAGIALDGKALGLDAPLRCVELVRLENQPEVKAGRIELALEPQEVRLIRVSR